MAGERRLSLRPISRQSKARKDASRVDARNASAERRIAMAFPRSRSIEPPSDPRDVLYPPGCYDNGQALNNRIAIIRQLQELGLSDAELVAAMARYNAMLTGDDLAVHAWYELLIRLFAAERARQPPPPEGYWDRRRRDADPDRDEWPRGFDEWV